MQRYALKSPVLTDNNRGDTLSPAKQQGEMNMATIAQKNDEFRKAILTNPQHEGGKVVLTSGFAGLDTEELAEVLTLVKNFSDFSVDNDPHQEHDFGSVTLSIPNAFT